MSAELASHLRDLLLAGRNPDGGWGYYAGKSSRLEPTCWALLSLLEDGRPEDAPVVETGFRLLGQWQRADGLVAEAQLPPNLAFNGLSSVALSIARSPAGTNPTHDEIRRRLLAGIVSVESIKLPDSKSISRQDNSLVGWPWTKDAFGWVEPTAWCTFGLKLDMRRRAISRSEARIAEAERLLLDRQCRGSGWNYGSSEVLGQELHAYGPPTALALLALQDHRERPPVRQALDYLLGAWRTEPSGMALGLSLLCFRVFGVPTGDVEAALAAAWERSGFLGNHSVIGLACCALTAGTHGPTAFRL